MNMILVPHDTYHENWQPIQKLRKAYSKNQENGQSAVEIHKHCVLTDDTNNRDDSGANHVVGRVFIENFRAQGPKQNYLLALRSHGFGEIVTIDVISTSHSGHRKLAYDYWQRMDSQFSQHAQSMGSIGEFLKPPYAFAGGLLSIDEKDGLGFSVRSECFSGELFDVSAHSIAAFIAESCGLEVKTNPQAGKQFVGWLLSISSGQHREAGSFYAHLTSAWKASLGSGAANLSRQQHNALKNMHARDSKLHRTQKADSAQVT